MAKARYPLFEMGPTNTTQCENTTNYITTCFFKIFFSSKQFVLGSSFGNPELNLDGPT